MGHIGNTGADPTGVYLTLMEAFRRSGIQKTEDVDAVLAQLQTPVYPSGSFLGTATPQLTVGYSSGQKLEMSVSSVGAVTLALTGSSPSMAITGGTLTWASVSKSGSSLADLATRSAGDLSSGTLADARVAASNVTQHQAALALAGSQITSGNLAYARLPSGAGTWTTGGLLTISDAVTITSGNLSVSSGKVVVLSAQSAAAPDYTFNGDTGNGSYQIGAGIYGIATGGIERLRIAAAGITAAVGVTVSTGGIAVTGDSAITGTLTTTALLLTGGAGFEINTTGTASLDITTAVTTGGVITLRARSLGAAAIQVEVDNSVTMVGATAFFSAVVIATGQTLTFVSANTISGTPTWSSSQAITLSTAAQPNVTSVGTLTSLTVSGTLALNGSNNLTLNGGKVIALSAQVATTPEFTFNADTDTGMFQQAADTLGFAAGGTERVRIGGTGLDIRSGDLYRNGTKLLGAQGASIADASGGTVIDAEARTALNALLARSRAHGFIAT